MSELIIRAESVSKRFRIGKVHDKSRLKGVLRTVGDMLGTSLRSDNSAVDFWALKDVSFDVHRGESVGIIGSNGAGKSTLLKILSRITGPTSGKIEIWGRMASLLEVGTGFVPVLTGRENVYLNGGALGMKRAEIRAKFDEIVEFAEVGQFVDTPVQRYSSGMSVRLAFSIAAHLRPALLIVDEVLAVGDERFRQKCLTLMRDYVHNGGTVLLVSHDSETIRSFCRTSIWLKAGRVELCGATEDIADRYASWTNAPTASERFRTPVSQAFG